jgi:membrane protease subunit HflC
MNKNSLLLIVVAVLLGGLYLATFTVNERELAIKFRLGQIERTDYDPGLHFMIPVVNNIRKFDARIQTLDAEPERYLTVEKKNVQVDSFVRWRIKDVEKFFISAGGDINRANLRLSQIVKDGLRGEFGRRTVQEVISGERKEIMRSITALADRETENFGIEVVDVRIKRVDLAREVSESVFQRMEAERERIAKELRSQGAEEAEKIRAEADRQRTILLAEARRESEQLRGNGDAKATEIYADAYSKDAEFYSFYRSLGAYEKSFTSTQDMLVLQPDSAFFNHFGTK